MPAKTDTKKYKYLPVLMSIVSYRQFSREKENGRFA